MRELKGVFLFATRLIIEVIGEEGGRTRCPLRWIDSFAMRNFTNDVIFDDTLPVADGILEVGYRVPLKELECAMADWFHRKSYLKPGDRLRITPEAAGVPAR